MYLLCITIFNYLNLSTKVETCRTVSKTNNFFLVRSHPKLHCIYTCVVPSVGFLPFPSYWWPSQCFIILFYNLVVPALFFTANKADSHLGIYFKIWFLYNDQTVILSFGYQPVMKHKNPSLLLRDSLWLFDKIRNKSLTCVCFLEE